MDYTELSIQDMFTQQRSDVDPGLVAALLDTIAHVLSGSFKYGPLAASLLILRFDRVVIQDWGSESANLEALA